MTIEEIRRWLSLCQAARKLPDRKWETWCFIVGTSGKLADRTLIGQAALQQFGRTWTYFANIKGADDE